MANELKRIFNEILSISLFCSVVLRNYIPYIRKKKSPFFLFLLFLFLFISTFSSTDLNSPYNTAHTFSYYFLSFLVIGIFFFLLLIFLFYILFTFDIYKYIIIYLCVVNIYLFVCGIIFQLFIGLFLLCLFNIYFVHNHDVLNFPTNIELVVRSFRFMLYYLLFKVFLLSSVCVYETRKKLLNVLQIFLCVVCWLNWTLAFVHLIRYFLYLFFTFCRL